MLLRLENIQTFNTFARGRPPGNKHFIYNHRKVGVKKETFSAGKLSSILNLKMQKLQGEEVFTSRTFSQNGPRSAGNPSQHVSFLRKGKIPMGGLAGGQVHVTQQHDTLYD